MSTIRTRVLAPLAAIAVTFSLAACSSADASGQGPTPAVSAQAESLTITDPWVKAADEGMTAAFGTLSNESQTDVRIVSANSDVTSSMELHEMTTGEDGATVMRQKQGGFVIKAGTTHELSPGGDHLMFMGLTEPVQAGAEVVVTLTAEDGSTFDFTAPARTFAGANEEYHGDEGHGSQDTHEHGDEGEHAHQ